MANGNARRYFFGYVVPGVVCVTCRCKWEGTPEQAAAINDGKEYKPDYTKSGAQCICPGGPH